MEHGIAVAQGVLWEMVLSTTSKESGRNGYLPSSKLYPSPSMLKEHYTVAGQNCTDIDKLIELMRHDKKNTSPDHINFTLLKEIGMPEWDICPSEEEIVSAYEIYGSLL